MVQLGFEPGPLDYKLLTQCNRPGSTISSPILFKVDKLMKVPGEGIVLSVSNLNIRQCLYKSCDCSCHIHVPRVYMYMYNFLPHLAGGKAASRVGPKIVLDHVRVYV